MASRALREWETWVEQQGYRLVAGVDEAGRGPLAGPVVACACILPKNHGVEGINDSKQLNADKRHEIFQQLIAHSEVVYGVGVVEVHEIDRINILQATFQAMRIAIAALKKTPDFVLVDGNKHIPKLEITQRAIIDGDALSESIAAASIIAKETRDEMMKKLHQKFPNYGFDHNMGYGTKEHLQALKDYGICEAHRRSFEPVKASLSKEVALDLFN